MGVLMGASTPPRLGHLAQSLYNHENSSQRGQALTRRRALEKMAQRGACSAPYASQIASCLQDGDQGVRRRAAESLARIGINGEGSAVTPHGKALAKCLFDTNPHVRTSAIDAICEMGPASEAYSLQLSQACRDSDANVRRKAAEALGRIGFAANPHITILASLLQDRDVGCRRAAAEAMLQMGMAAAPFAKELAHLLDDDAVGLRWTIADGLQNLGYSGAVALSARLKDKNTMVRETASMSLEQMGWEAIREPAELTCSPRYRYRRQAAAIGNAASHVPMRI